MKTAHGNLDFGYGEIPFCIFFQFALKMANFKSKHAFSSYIKSSLKTLFNNVKFVVSA